VTEKKFRYIYGVVFSRRLGKSLGIDIIPFKTCSYDCIYCQLGATNNKTIIRKDFLSLAEEEVLIKEIESKLNEAQKVDYLTFSGSGEPTLNMKLGSLISKLKNIFSLKVAVITNGSLLFEKEVQEELKEADIVLPTLAAQDETSFLYINRPCPELNFYQVIEGLISFKKRFKGKFWLEVFLLKNINDGEENLLKLKELINKINPDKVQLNTAIRPSQEDYALPISSLKLNKICKFFGEKAEVISYPKVAYTQGKINDILALLKRRPLTIEELTEYLSLSKIEVLKYLDMLKQKNLIFQKENYVRYNYGRDREYKV
jgi:wyosine [tRNA(Phe)-imidazoG37] synthetase (radical SAM superfamily)